MPNEREIRDLQAIKDRVQDLKNQIFAGAREVQVYQFTVRQLGLRPIYADERGRLWRDDGDRLTNIGYWATERV